MTIDTSHWDWSSKEEINRIKWKKCRKKKKKRGIKKEHKRHKTEERIWWSKGKGMFGNCFFPLFSVFKNNFLFLRLKNLFGNSKQAENKNCFQNLICEENWKHARGCFQFLIFKSQWKHAFNLMNLSHLMS